jgi:hypothetical protein
LLWLHTKTVIALSLKQGLYRTCQYKLLTPSMSALAINQKSNSRIITV